MNRKEIAVLSVIIFLSVIAWIVFGVFHTKNTSTISSVDLKKVVPLTPTFDNDIIRELQNREE